ncbi:electron transporter RnfD [Bacteroides thetaiotaomicron]|nr:electron transporter RnfD [Bacteroides thetaiotaomicron]
MKYYLSTFAGSAICGGFAFGIWPELWKTYGLMGGWLAATLIIGIMWYMNHYNGAILNPPGKNMARSGLVYRFCRYSLGNRPLSGRHYQFLLCSAYTGLLSDRRCTGGNCSLENPFVRLCPKDKIRRRTQ